jgi:hypothetical protein
MIKVFAIMKDKDILDRLLKLKYHLIKKLLSLLGIKELFYFGPCLNKFLKMLSNQNFLLLPKIKKYRLKKLRVQLGTLLNQVPKEVLKANQKVM